MVNRIDTTFSALHARNQKAMIAYIAAGDPSLAATEALVPALERAGVDLVELGLPFSDPLADGIVNQLAAARALEAGLDRTAGQCGVVEARQDAGRRCRDRAVGADCRSD